MADILKADHVQKPEYMLPKGNPQAVCGAAFAITAARHGIMTDGCSYRFIDGSYDIGNRDLGGWPSKTITAPRPTNRAYQSVFAQQTKELFKVRQ